MKERERERNIREEKRGRKKPERKRDEDEEGRRPRNDVRNKKGEELLLDTKKKSYDDGSICGKDDDRDVFPPQLSYDNIQ